MAAMFEETFGKVMSRDDVAADCRTRRSVQKLRLGLTVGVFDLLHVGHISYLEHLRRECDLLAVGVNSDRSVQALKGPTRPLNGEQQRARLLAALSCVDYVFIFDEPNSRRSVEALRPDVYAKGGDYSPENLSAHDLLCSYGARILICPLVEGVSTSAALARIARIEASRPQHIALPPPPRQPAVFLDRDGTINKFVDYLHEPDRFTPLPGVFPALRRLRAAGYRLVIVTNQPGIGTGYFSKDDFFLVNKQMLMIASDAGVLFDRVFYCPHSIGDRCSCRKPGTALIERAAAELNLDLSCSFFIGDMTTDVAAGRAAGCSTILVKTGRGGRDGRCSVRPDFVAANLEEAASLILANGITRSAAAAGG